jgi:hypothetical protein
MTTRLMGLGLAHGVLLLLDVTSLA